MTNPAQYKAKLEAYTEGKDPIAMQSDAPRILAELIEGVTEQAPSGSGPSGISGLQGRSLPISRRTKSPAVGGIGR